MKSLLVILCMLFSSNVFAFSEAEKNEIKKVVRARLDQMEAGRRIGRALRESSDESNRADYFTVLQSWITAHFICGFTFGDFVNSPPQTGNPTRPQRVADAFQSLIDCQKALDKTRTDIDAILESNPLNLSAAQKLLTRAIDELARVDTTLSYMDWLPPSFPRITGPHGDYLYGQSTLIGTHRYFSHVVKDAILWYGTTAVIPRDSASLMGQVMGHAGRAAQAHTRGWALASKIILANDEATIRADEAAGSGLRPFEFFVEPLAIEYLYNQNPNKVNFAGRKLKQGAPQQFFGVGAKFSRAVETAAVVNTAEEVRRWLLPSGGSFSTFTNVGRVAEFMEDFGDFWTRHDNYAAALQVFFFEIPAPPGGPGPPMCPDLFPVPSVTIDGVEVVCRDR